MKEDIILVLRTAAELDAELRDEMSRSSIGNKENVLTNGKKLIGKRIVAGLLALTPTKVVESEEYGKTNNLRGNENEEYYVAIDSIDGFNNLRIRRGMYPYASMIVAFDGNKKTDKGYKYSDYAYAACLEYTSGRIYYTEKGLGEVEVYNLSGEKIIGLMQSEQNNEGIVFTLGVDNVSLYRGRNVGHASTRDGLHLGAEPGILDAVYTNFSTADTGCSVFEYAMVGTKKRIGYVAYGKEHHKLPLLYAFCKETGQEMVDFEGNSYDDRIYEFSGKNAEVIAGTPQVVDRVMRYINLQREQIRENAESGKKVEVQPTVPDER